MVWETARSWNPKIYGLKGQAIATSSNQCLNDPFDSDDHPIWLRWPVSLAKMTVQFGLDDRLVWLRWPSTFERTPLNIRKFVQLSDLTKGIHPAVNQYRRLSSNKRFPYPIYVLVGFKLYSYRILKIWTLVFGPNHLVNDDKRTS